MSRRPTPFSVAIVIELHTQTRRKIEGSRGASGSEVKGVAVGSPAIHGTVADPHTDPGLRLTKYLLK